jgi:hypothetical protein
MSLTGSRSAAAQLTDQRFRFAATSAGAAGDLYIFGGQNPLSRSAPTAPTPVHPVLSTIHRLRHVPLGLANSGSVTVVPLNDGDGGNSGWAPTVGIILLVLTLVLASLLVAREMKWRAATAELRAGLGKEIEMTDVKMDAAMSPPRPLSDAAGDRP